MSLNEECSEPEWGWSEAGLGKDRVRTETGLGLNQDLFRTGPGPTGTTEMPKYNAYLIFPHSTFITDLID